MGRIVKIIDSNGGAHYIDSAEGGTVLFALEKNSIPLPKGYTVVDSLGRESRESLITRVSDPLRIVPFPSTAQGMPPQGMPPQASPAAPAGTSVGPTGSVGLGSRSPGGSVPSSAPMGARPASPAPHPYPQPYKEGTTQGMPKRLPSTSPAASPSPAVPPPLGTPSSPSYPQPQPPVKPYKKSTSMDTVIGIVIVIGVAVFILIVGGVCCYFDSSMNNTSTDDRCRILEKTENGPVIIKNMNYFIIASSGRPIHINFDFLAYNKGSTGISPGELLIDASGKAKDGTVIGSDPNFSISKSLPAGGETTVSYSPGYTIPSTYKDQYLQFEFVFKVKTSLSTRILYEILMADT